MKLLIKLLIAGGAVSAPAFTVTMTALSNALGTVTTLAYINPGSGGGGGSFTPSFTMSRSTGKENLAVYFDASATASAFATNAEHECKFEWNFGDEDGTYWPYGRDLAQSRNVAYGPQAAHVFKTAGIKTITLTVTDPMGNVGTLTDTVTVTAWTEAETIYIANGSPPTAGANGVGYGAAGYYNETTWAGVISRKAANKRIRLNNASTWAASASLTCENGMQVDGYGAGSKWNVTTGTWAYGAVFDVKNRSDVRIIGGKHTGTGSGSDLIEANTLGGGAGASTGCINILMMDMESVSTYGIWSSSTNAYPDGIFVVNCKCTDVAINDSATGAIPVYIEYASRLVILGSKFDNVQSSHCTRIAGGERVVIANSQLSRAVRPVNHCLTLRGFTNHVDSEVFNGQYTEKVVVCDNYFMAEAACGYMLHIGPQNDGYAERHRNIIVERNYFNSALASTMQAQVIGGTCTIRNNLFEIDKGTVAILVSAQSNIDNGSPSDTRIYNNTCYKKTLNTFGSGDGFSFIVISTETNFDPGYSAPTAITGLDIRNNLAYAPNDTKNWNQSNGGAGADFITIAGLTPSYRAASSNNSSNTQVRTVRPWAATTPATYADFAPASGSYAENGGSTDVWVFEDFLGAAITGTRDIGAVQA